MKNIYGSNKIERYVLNNGVEIPAVAFGTYKAADGKSADVIRAAIGQDTDILIRRLSTEPKHILRKRSGRAGFPGESFLSQASCGKTRWDMKM